MRRKILRASAGTTRRRLLETVPPGGPDALKARIARELPLWREVVDAAGIKPQ